MKKLRQFVSVFITFAVLMSGFSCFAESRRINPRHVKEPLNRMTESTVMLYDFYSDEIAASPNGFTKHADIRVALYEAEEGYTKNCMEITDNTHDSGFTGPTTKVPLTNTVGIGSFEIRYKYVPVSPSKYASVALSLLSNSKTLARFTVGSSRGSSTFCDKKVLESNTISSDTWYVLKIILDFENGVMDASLTNEGTGKTTTATDVSWYTAGTYESIDTFLFQGSSYGGIWVIDYIRQEEDADRIDIGESIEKGCPQTNIPSPVSHVVKGRTNITLNGKYKYTATAPVITDNDNVAVTLKNIARILGLTYSAKDGVYTVSSADTQMAFTAGAQDAIIGEDKITLIEKTFEQDGQLMVCAEDVAKAFGINYTYDKENNTVVLTTGEEVTGK